MRLSVAIIVLALLATVAPHGVPIHGAPSVPISEPTEYRADPTHSSVRFRVRHLGISWVDGRFGSFEATFAYDPDDVTASWVRASIEASSIDTDNERRDRHLRSEDFLHAEAHPELRFESRSVSRVAENRLSIQGDLTIRGVTRPVTLDARLEGRTRIDGQDVIAWTAETAIDRKEYGLVWNRATEAGGFVVGDEVRIEIDVEARSSEGDGA